MCHSSFWSCAFGRLLKCSFGKWSNREIHVIFIFFLGISWNRWTLRTLFYLKHSPSCTLSLFKYKLINQVIRGSPEVKVWGRTWLLWRIKKKLIKQRQPSGMSVLASQGWQWGWFYSICHAGSSKLLSHVQFWVFHSPHVQTFIWQPWNPEAGLQR